MFPTSVFIVIATLAMQQVPATATADAPVAPAVTEPSVVAADRGMVIMPHTSREIVVARIGSDGKPVLACVDSDEAARRFLAAPRERLATGRAQEN